MPRKPHPKKEVEAAIRHAESKGWRVEVGGGHAWGKMYCPYNNELCRCGESRQTTSEGGRQLCWPKT